MKKNILVVLGVILVLVVAAGLVAGISLYKMYNPKGCVSFEVSNYPPAYDIVDGVYYDNNSTEMSKIYAVKDSCMAAVKGEDASVDKCEALNVLREFADLVYTNAANSQNAVILEEANEYLLNMQKDLSKTSASSCQTEYKDLNKTFADIQKLMQGKKSAK